VRRKPHNNLRRCVRNPRISEGFSSSLSRILQHRGDRIGDLGRRVYLALGVEPVRAHKHVNDAAIDRDHNHRDARALALAMPALLLSASLAAAIGGRRWRAAQHQLPDHRGRIDRSRVLGDGGSVGVRQLDDERAHKRRRKPGLGLVALHDGVRGASGQYYYHAFLAAQPDLNWRNPAVRSAIYEVMRFWFRRGVDGFRVDVVWHLIKDDEFRDNPPNADFRLTDPPYHRLVPLYTADRPEVHDVIAEMRRVADAFPDRVLIGEIYLPLERLVAYYGRDLAGMHLPFNFSLLSTPWHAPSIARLIAEYEAALPTGGWPNWVLGNHDRPRIASRVGSDQARIAAMLLLTLRGTPTVYYGDEIAMKDMAIAPAQVCDPLGKNLPGRGLGRDGCRTPMQWDSTTHAGFSSVEPWLPMGGALDQNNVLVQGSNNTSVYRLYRRLIDLRRKCPALSLGSYGSVRADGNLLVFTREYEREHLLVALNFASEPVAASLPSGEWFGRLLVSSAGDRADEPVRGSVNLRAHEGAIVKLCDRST
jgi:alpha-glucosidase